MKAKNIIGELLTVQIAETVKKTDLFLSPCMSISTTNELIKFPTQYFNKTIKLASHRNSPDTPTYMMVIVLVLYFKILTSVLSMFQNIQVIIDKLFAVFHLVAMFVSLSFKDNVATAFILSTKIVSLAKFGNKISKSSLFSGSSNTIT